jgi:hypothetical protein
MAEPTVFYAWQSDLSPEITKKPIRKAAEDAIKELGREAAIEDSPRLDSDTKGLSGHPEVAKTIFEKIDNAAVFLADMTLVAEFTTHDKRKKLVSNANVLHELGYAAARMGWDRIVLVMNTVFGEPDALLFDIIHRRHPLDFKIKDEDPAYFEETRKSLADKLTMAFRAAFKAPHAKVDGLIRRLDVNCLVVAMTYGQAGHFSGPPPGEFRLGSPLGQLDTPAFNAAILRLLDLELIHSDVDPQKGLYAYHWTY